MVPLTRPAVAPNLPMLDIGALAALLGISDRHIRRLVDSGRCPAPLRLGKCLRWNRMAVESWIAAGCPSLRKSKGGAA